MQRAGSPRAPTALAHQLPRSVGSASSPTAVPATAAVSYINQLGGMRSHRMSQLARHLLLWSHTQFKSLCAVHILGKLNRVADALSQQLTFPREWQLYFSLTGTHLASGLTQVCISPSEPTRTDTVQAQGGRGAGPAGCAPLAHPDLVSQTHFPRDSTSLVHSSEEGHPLSGARPDLWNPHVWLLDGTRQT